MGHKKKRNRDKDKPGVLSPDLREKLEQGLTPQQMSDPVLMNRIMRGLGELPHGTVQSFASGAPGTPPAEDLPFETADDSDSEPDDIPEGGNLPLRAGQILDLQADMHGRLARRDPYWASYLGSFMEDSVSLAKWSKKEAYERWGVMFQPATTADQYMGILARQLSMARTYQVTGKMADVVNAVYEKSAAHVDYFQAEDVPWPSGFVYLNKPLVLHDRRGLTVKNRALSWNMEQARVRRDFTPGAAFKPGGVTVRESDLYENVPAVRIVCWSWWADKDHYWDETVARVMRNMGGLSLAHSILMPFGQQYRPLTERRTEEGLPIDDISRWLHALWLLMESEVPAMRRAADVDHAARKRAQKSLNSNDVTVVLLRRTISRELEEGDPGHRYVDWSCRWPVQGFWRHHQKQHHHAVPDRSREFCLVCANRISWVRPHLRGPSYLPLKQSGQLYRLAR